MLSNSKLFRYCSFGNTFSSITILAYFDCSLFQTLYKWIHLNLNGEEAQTVENWNSEHIVFQNNMQNTHNKMKIHIKYTYACNETS